MDAQTYNFCANDDRLYPHGTEQCISGRCMLCVEGQWKERIEVCSSSAMTEADLVGKVKTII
jgi:hypothetical protein